MPLVWLCVQVLGLQIFGDLLRLKGGGIGGVTAAQPCNKGCV